ncbi:MAG: diguanylate cyclase [Clostridia bacterium]|nr:diguanylate cyclase [Clostridia bacterium]
MIIAIIVVLVAIIIFLMIYNMSVHKKIDTYNNLNQKIVSLNVLQEFMDTISAEKSPDEKIKKINEILIEKYDIKYSTIVVYDGAEYTIKSTNVDEKHWPALSTLHNEEIFKDSIETATPKYITVDKEGERLPYQKMEFGRAKSAMFFPLYIDNVYIGYWIIESGKPHDFDQIDTTILEVVRNNIVSVIKTVDQQEIIEKIVREDKYSGLKTAEYLYGEGKRRLEQYDKTAICMFKIINIVDINEKLGRNTGNNIISEISNVVRQNISAEYVFVRYMGPKFAIAFSGIDVDGIDKFLIQLKKSVEEIKIKQAEEDLYEDEKPKAVSPKINIAVTTYYKGTAIEGTTKKLEEYLDYADSKESQINYI